MTKKTHWTRNFLVGIAALAAAGIWAQREGWILKSGEDVTIVGAPVRRGELEITVTERGNLTAKNSASLKSELEGRSTLLFLIDEGTHVEVGDLVAELDTAELVDRRVAQEITVQSARASATKAREGVEIQIIENESQIAKARQQVEFARIDLEKYIGASLDRVEEISLEEALALAHEATALEDSNEPDHDLTATAGEASVDSALEGESFGGGDRGQELQRFSDDIRMAELEQKRAEDTLIWSRALAEKGFVERTELEGDELAFERAGIQLKQAELARGLLLKYEHPKEWARLQGELSEAERQLRKASKQAVAQLADYEAAREATRVKLALEEEKLAKIGTQIGKGKVLAPVAGMVVYGRTEGSRMGGGEPMQEGGEVRERQEIATIPGEGGMVAEASIHESALKQVSAGLPVIVRVDALPGNEFYGVVDHVAVLPDKNSWWANPNLRLYKTEIQVGGGDAEMRPGMSCSIEILVETIADTVYVPLQAVHHSGMRNLCWVRIGGRTEERTVQIGQHNDKWVAIVSGLTEGEIVLLSPPTGFEPTETAEEEAGSGTGTQREGGWQGGSKSGASAETGTGSPGMKPAGAPAGEASPGGGAEGGMRGGRQGGGRPASGGERGAGQHGGGGERRGGERGTGGK